VTTSGATAVDPVTELFEQVLALRAEVAAATPARSTRRVASRHIPSSVNLAHYLALRRHDIRPLQHALASRGLSSLGRSEAHVLATLDAVAGVLARLADRPAPDPVELPVTMDRGPQLLAANADALFGPAAVSATRVMVTLPSEAAVDEGLVRDLLAAGATCVRINAAHDGPEAWAAMAAVARRAERDTGATCRLFVDLAGPKLRTGEVEPVPAVIKVRPRRDRLGRVLAPGRVVLAPPGAPLPPTGAAVEELPELDDLDELDVVPVERSFLARREPGERIGVVDTRGAARDLDVVARVGEVLVVAVDRTTYLAEGVRLRAGRETTAVAPIPPDPGSIPLERGDELVLTAGDAARSGRPAVLDDDGAVVAPATIPCTLPAAFDHLRPGHRILFDDGRIGGLVVAVGDHQASVRITSTPGRRARLRAEKGINLPDTLVDVPALTDDDRQALAFAVAHADAVSLSFVRSPADVADLHAHLARLGRPQLPVVLKIETVEGFRRLPELVTAGLAADHLGVMIARGDLAVECGWERLAEVQEEILWLCEAAHVPVVWATQVLDELAKRGQPSRAEITDAAMGVRAECVMLNKGPHVVAAVRALTDILGRMEGHQHKKRPLLRELTAWYPAEPSISGR
jgi:pyruvate kinase